MKNITIQEVINEVDRKIRIERLYLHKKHKNGVFDFQLSGIGFEPYKVDHERIIYPLIEKMTIDEFHSSELMQDVYLLRDYRIDELYKNYFNTGVLGRTLLLDNEGNFVFTEYYKNIQPQSYSFKLSLPINDEQRRDALHRLSYSFEKIIHGDEKILHLDIHFPEEIRQEMKTLNPGIKFNRKTALTLKKESNILSWNEIEINIKNLINRLDDSCVNIFNRVDYIHYLTNNVNEIRTAIDHLSDKGKASFKDYYQKNKDWFDLIVEAIDLTNNKTYKRLVNVEKANRQAEKIADIMQYIVYNIILDNKPNDTKKRKI